MERFVDELLPRDVVAKAIQEEMKKDNKPYVWLSMKPIPTEMIKSHFPNIYKHCLEEGYDVKKNVFPLCRHSIILWVVSTLINTARRQWTDCTQSVKRRATVFTAKIVLQAIHFLKVLFLQNVQQ